jgi:hypothetical protein
VLPQTQHLEMGLMVYLGREHREHILEIRGPQMEQMLLDMEPAVVAESMLPPILQPLVEADHQE